MRWPADRENILYINIFVDRRIWFTVEKSKPGQISSITSDNFLRNVREKKLYFAISLTREKKSLKGKGLKFFRAILYLLTLRNSARQTFLWKQFVTENTEVLYGDEPMDLFQPRKNLFTGIDKEMWSFWADQWRQLKDKLRGLRPIPWIPKFLNKVPVPFHLYSCAMDFEEDWACAVEKIQSTKRSRTVQMAAMDRKRWLFSWKGTILEYAPSLRIPILYYIWYLFICLNYILPGICTTAGEQTRTEW